MSERAPTNLMMPFRRDRASDFASAAGRELLRSKILQVMMTEGDTPQSGGELPWRTAFGSGVHLARHARNDAALAELTRVRLRDALARWLSTSVDIRVDALVEHNHLRMLVRIGDDEIGVDEPRPA